MQRLLPAAAVFLGAASAALGVCGPFTDVAPGGLCPNILEIFTLGITTGTSPTTYDPTGHVSRLQMAAFLSRTVDSVLQRGSRRVLTKKTWVPRDPAVLGVTTLGGNTGAVQRVASDGTDVWVADQANSAVRRIRASDGRVLDTWTGAISSYDVLPAMGRVFATGSSTAQSLYRFDPSAPAGAVTTLTTQLPFGSGPLAFDGSRIWVASSGGIAVVTPADSLPWTVTVPVGGIASSGILYDGTNVWATNRPGGTLLKLGADGAVLQTVTVGAGAFDPAFDGTNIWVPNSDANTVSVVRASTGAVLATLTDESLDAPSSAAFDGQRVLVTNLSGDSVTLWKAADFSAIGSFSLGNGAVPVGVCSDGIQFWITLFGTHQLVRF